MAVFGKTFHQARYYYWLIIAYTKKHFLFLILGLSFGIIFGLQFPVFFNYLTKDSKTERIGIIGNYTLKNLPLDIQRQISLGLTVFDSTGRIKPGLSEGYEIKEGGKKYIFHLKKYLRWHDGSLFTTADINYQFKDVKITKINSSQIVFELTKSFAPFPSLVTQPLFKTGLIGLGNYQVESYIMEGKFLSKLIIFSNTHKIVYKFYPTENEILIGYKLGEINTILNLKNPDPLINYPHTHLEKVINYHQYVGLFLNNKKGVLQDKSFRQALNYAIEDSKIKAERAYGPISPDSWAFNQNLKTYDYNLDTALKLIDKNISASESAKLSLKITVIKPYEEYLDVISESWKQIGIKTQVEKVALAPERFEVLLAAQEIPLDPDQYLIWHSTSQLNLTGYNSPRIDKLLEDGRQLIDEKERREKYLDFQKYLVEDSPVIFLYYPTSYNVKRI